MNASDKQEQQTNSSDFSIDHILNRAGQKTCISINDSKIAGNSRPNDITFPRFPEEQYSYHPYSFQWLSCTRYQPPKLQRNPKIGPVKRQPGRHPRIPFTPAQIDTLERSYEVSPYLCPNEVTKLSSELELSDARIKIWFQNRRAREKREKEHTLATNSNSIKTATQDFSDCNDHSYSSE